MLSGLSFGCARLSRLRDLPHVQLTYELGFWPGPAQALERRMERFWFLLMDMPGLRLGDVVW